MYLGLGFREKGLLGGSWDLVHADMSTLPAVITTCVYSLIRFWQRAQGWKLLWMIMDKFDRDAFHQGFKRLKFHEFS